MPDREKAIRILEGNYKNFVLRHNGELFTINELIALLKAQEPVKPLKMEFEHVRKEPVVFSYECPVCMCGLQRHWVACPICGTAVKWE